MYLLYFCYWKDSSIENCWCASTTLFMCLAFTRCRLRERIHPAWPDYTKEWFFSEKMSSTYSKYFLLACLLTYSTFCKKGRIRYLLTMTDWLRLIFFFCYRSNAFWTFWIVRHYYNKRYLILTKAKTVDSLNEVPMPMNSVTQFRLLVVENNDVGCALAHCKGWLGM